MLILYFSKECLGLWSEVIQSYLKAWGWLEEGSGLEAGLGPLPGVASLRGEGDTLAQFDGVSNNLK